MSTSSGHNLMAASTVQLVRLPGEEQEDSSGLDIIFVYGVTAQGSQDEVRRWPATITALAPPRSNVFGCDLRVRLCPMSGQTPGWKDLVARAGELLEALYHFQSKRKNPLRPIVFFCHTFGGWTVKQTLWRAAQQFNRFRDIIELISGIVFLATPHITESNDASSQALSLVLRSDLMSNPKRAFTKPDLSYLAYSALRFEELKVEMPVLSCHETKETKLRAPLWFSRKAILVGPDVAKTSAPGEKLVAIDTELASFFETVDCVIHISIASYLRSTLSEACARIRDMSRSNCLSTDSRQQVLLANSLVDKNGEMALSSLRSASSVGNLQVSADSSQDRTTPVSQRLSTPHSPPQLSQMLSSSPQSFQTQSSFEIVPKSMDFTGPKAQANFPCYSTRPYTTRNKEFRGRQDILNLIHASLVPKEAGGSAATQKELKTFTLCGLGGIGKTQIAVEFVFSRMDLFDAIFWLQADDPQKLEMGFVQIALQLGLQAKDSLNDAAATRDIVKSWLADPLKWYSQNDVKQVKWLLVFDNADNPDSIMNHDLWPREGNGSILVTSRDPMSRSKTFFGDAGVDLDTLPIGEAATLLRSLSNRESEPNSRTSSMEIARNLDCFPLAVVQMAGIIQRRNLTLSDFLDLYNQETERAELHRIKVGPQSGYSLTLSTAWSLEGLGSGASQILAVISLLDPDCIQEDILTLGSPDPEFELSGFPKSKGAYFRDLAELTQSSILSRNAERKELSIHRVVQDVVKSRLLQSADELADVFQATVTLLSAQWPFVTKPVIGRPNFGQVERWDQCEKILPHTIKLGDIFEKISGTTQSQCATKEFAWLLADTAWYHYERSNPKDCLHLVDIAFKLLDVTKHDLRDILAELHGTRAAVAFDTNDSEAALYHMEQNKMFREEDLEKTGVPTNKLAAAYSETGKALLLNGLYSKGEQLLNESMEIRLHLPGFTRHALYNCLAWLAVVNWQRGEYEKASDLLLEALRDRELSFGRDDTGGPRTGILLMHLGTVRASQNQFDESYSYLQRALLQLRATVGDNHHLTAQACCKLSLQFVRFRDYSGALKLLDQASNVYSRGPYYASSLARVKFLTYGVLNLMGDSLGAERALQKAWELRKTLIAGDTREAHELQQVDFDEIVAFWTV